MALTADDVESVAFGDPTMDVFAGRFEGKAAMEARLVETGRTFEFHRFEPIEFVSEEGRVAVRVACEATLRATGERIDSELAHFWTVRDGKAVRILEYFDTARVGKAFAAR